MPACIYVIVTSLETLAYIVSRAHLCRCFRDLRRSGFRAGVSFRRQGGSRPSRPPTRAPSVNWTEADQGTLAGRQPHHGVSFDALGPETKKWDNGAQRVSFDCDRKAAAGAA